MIIYLSASDTDLVTVESGACSYHLPSPDASDDSAAAVVKPYQFRMSEIEGFRYRVTVRIFHIVSIHHS